MYAILGAICGMADPCICAKIIYTFLSSISQPTPSTIIHKISTRRGLWGMFLKPPSNPKIVEIVDVFSIFGILMQL